MILFNDYRIFINRTVNKQRPANKTRYMLRIKQNNTIENKTSKLSFDESLINRKK